MAHDEAKESRREPAPSGHGAEWWALEDLEALAGSLRDLTEVLTRLHGRIERFLPKMAATEADSENGQVSGGEVSRESVDALVEEHFQQIFGDEEPPRDTRADPDVAGGGARDEERRAGLWLRVQRGARILEIPCSWVRDAPYRVIEERGRVRLEDETGEAEIPVDRVLGVVFSSRRSKPREGVFRPKSVGDLALLGPGTGSAPGAPPEGAVSAPSSAGGPSVPETVEVEDAVRNRTVVVASRSGIVRRFLGRHLQAFGLNVVESEDPVPALPQGDCLGLFWDGEASGAAPSLPAELPVVRLSHRDDRSDTSAASEAPVLAKPFSRGEVRRALLWMLRRGARLRASDDGESRARTEASRPTSESG